MNTEKLYLECYAGIAGDMLVAALLDLGADKDFLLKNLKSLNLDGYSVEISRVNKSGLDVCDFAVKLDVDNHDHDMEYLHGHEHHHDHEHHHHHDHEHEHHHHHDHDHEHEHHHDHEHHHHHEHRGLPEIEDIIKASGISEEAKATSLRIFDILAEAEAKAHGKPKNEVHFHEVGAIDSIVDIVAIAVCMENLGIKDVIVGELYEGSGFVRCQHGQMPVPVPAVANIAAANNLKLHMTDIQGELVTPTGAAAVAALRTEDKLPSSFTVKAVGCGAGKRTYDRPSIVRAMIIETGIEAEKVIKLECNIDDATGEMLGFAMQRLMAAGARDCYFIPIYMKKNRPAYLLTAVCTEDEREDLEEIIFEETTTIGIRRVEMERTLLERDIVVLDSPYGRVKYKEIVSAEETRFVPEYNSAANIARQTGKSFRSVYTELTASANQK